MTMSDKLAENLAFFSFIAGIVAALINLFTLDLSPLVAVLFMISAFLSRNTIDGMRKEITGIVRQRTKPVREMSVETLQLMHELYSITEETFQEVGELIKTEKHLVVDPPVRMERFSRIEKLTVMISRLDEFGDKVSELSKKAGSIK